MRDAVWKLGVLRRLLLYTFEDWRRDIWQRDPDEHYCCPGDPMIDECGCQGVTLREVYTSAVIREGGDS